MYYYYIYIHILVELGFKRIWGHGGEGMRVMYGVMREGVGASV